MARFASFTTPDAGMPGGGQTLQALMARQKALADQQAAMANANYPGQGTVAGGLGHMAQMFFTGLAESRAAQQEAAQRARLAEIIGGVGDTGATNQQIGEVFGIDPEIGTRLLTEASAARRADREYQRSRADTLSDRAAQYAHEGEVDTRELQQQKDQEARAEGARVREAQAAEARASEEKKREGATIVVTGQAAKDRGLDPSRTWSINTFTNKPDDITPTPQETFGPIISGDQAKELGLDPTKQYQLNEKTKRYEPVGGAGITIQNVPPELAAKIGLADEFLANYDSVRKSAEAGEMTGLIDYQSAVGLGRGSGGQAYRDLKAGSEALIRMLTGAGKQQSEAEDEARQYLPTFTDDAKTLVAKIDGLKRRLERVRGAVGTGRNMLPEPGATTTSDLPEGVTEDDMAETMKATGLTREQVLAKLKEKANAGP